LFHPKVHLPTWFLSSIFLFLTACGGGGSVSSTNNSSPTTIGDGVTPSGILCDYKGSGITVTKLTDNSSQPFQFAWTCGSTMRTLTSNGIPNHTVGTFPNPNNPNTIAPYAVNFSAPISPLLDMVKPVPIVGYALNGVKFDPNTGGAASITLLQQQLKALARHLLVHLVPIWAVVTGVWKQ